jgi:malonyl-CoA O-methyltransferase
MSAPAAPLDAAAIARSFGAASGSYDAAAWLQAAVRSELLSRLDLLRQPPRAMLDLGAGTGVAAAALKQRFRRAAVTAADIAAPMLAQVRRRSRFWRPIRCVEADARTLPFEDASFDLVFTSLMLQWLQPPDVALREMRRVLKPGGLLLASSFGPQTLQELRDAWRAADAGVHVNEFVDMHDLGSALHRAGFIEPVLDVDRHVQHYPDTRALMRELKSLGARNLHAARARGLTGRRTFAAMNAAYDAQRQAHGLPATWQVVYAVAWAPAAGVGGKPAFGSDASGEVRIDVDSLRSHGRR